MSDARSEAGQCGALAGELLANHCRFADPYPALARLREQEPVARAGDWYVVTDFDSLVAGYRDPRISRHRQAVAEMEAHAHAGEVDDDLRFARLANVSMLINQDGAAHRRIRQILDVAFKPSRVAGWQARIDAIMDELVAAHAGETDFDFLRLFAYPLPERVICELVGVPHADHKLWGQWADDIVGAARTHEPDAALATRVEDAQRSFYRYFRDLVAHRGDTSGEDLVSLLLRAEADGERLQPHELYGTLQMLVTAGHETTANLIGNGLVALIRHPDQYDRLRADPSLVDSAVEEMLRFASPSLWSLPREPVEAVELGGVAIAPGSPIIMALSAANRDPIRFPDPDRFDIGRAPNRHVAFAAGPHFCLGNQLARMEARAMFRAVATRLPRYELAAEPVVKQTFVRAYTSVMVRREDDQGSR